MNKVQLHQRGDGKWAWRVRNTENGQIVANDGGQGFESATDARRAAEATYRGLFATYGDPGVPEPGDGYPPGLAAELVPDHLVSTETTDPELWAQWYSEHIDEAARLLRAGKADMALRVLDEATDHAAFSRWVIRQEGGWPVG